MTPTLNFTIPTSVLEEVIRVYAMEAKNVSVPDQWKLRSITCWGGGKQTSLVFDAGVD